MASVVRIAEVVWARYFMAGNLNPWDRHAKRGLHHGHRGDSEGCHAWNEGC